MAGSNSGVLRVTSGRGGDDEKLVKLVGPTDIFQKNPDFFAFSLQNQFFIAKIKFFDAEVNFSMKSCVFSALASWPLHVLMALAPPIPSSLVV